MKAGSIFVKNSIDGSCKWFGPDDELPYGSKILATWKAFEYSSNMRKDMLKELEEKEEKELKGE